jgi:hypothetical protein
MTDVLGPGVGLLVGVLADDAPRNTGPDFGKASPFGLVITVILLICVFALVWSMNRHLKRLPESFDRKNPGADQAADEGTLDTGEAQVSERAPDDSVSDNGGTPREPGG